VKPVLIRSHSVEWMSTEAGEHEIIVTLDGVSVGGGKKIACNGIVNSSLGFELTFLCAQIQLDFLNCPAYQCLGFPCTVVPGLLDASKCVCQGIGLETARAGEETMFSVIIFDGFGNPRLIGGDEISATIHQGGIDVNHDGKGARVNDLGCGRSSTQQVHRALTEPFHSYHQSVRKLSGFTVNSGTSAHIPPTSLVFMTLS